MLILEALDDGAPPPRFTRAAFAPGRALMLVQAWAQVPGLGEVEVITAPPLAEATARLADPSDRFGNEAFAFGGAILAPFANRIRGTPTGGGLIRTRIGDRDVDLAANWGRGLDTPEPYAMHGLILKTPARGVDQGAGVLSCHIAAGDFGVGWPSRTDLAIVWRLTGTALSLKVTARNTGPDQTWIGLGWHPYFNLPSGDRAQARLHIPSTRRVAVGDYSDVLPTGEIIDCAGTEYDFSAPDGRALGGLYLDDCYTDLARSGKDLCVSLSDPAVGYGLSLWSRSPAITAVQTYAPPDKAFVALEPQFNLADPFNPAWNGRATGMQALGPGEEACYDCRVAMR